MMFETSSGPRAVFRCDGGEGHGLGHVTRCLALAEALVSRRWSCTFAVSAATAALQSLSRSSFLVRTLDEPLEADELTQGDGPDLLVIDGYHLDHVYERACTGWAGAVLAMDDAPARAHAADIVLDIGYGCEPSDYAGKVSPQCRLLVGGA